MSSIRLLKKIRFGLLQYPIHNNPGKTLPHLLKLLERIKKKNPHYIVLPEMWLGGPKKQDERGNWAQFYKQVFGELCEWGRKNKIGCFLSQIEREGKKFYNTAFFVERDGAVKGSYRKIHLFSLGGETKIFSPGKTVRPFSGQMGKIGVVICYDIRFPELVRKLAIGGSQILIVCAQWPTSRMDHWLTLLKARAIENQMFVVAVNRLGRKGKISYNGHSVVFDPWGRCLMELPPSRELGVVEIDLADVEKIRTQYPFFKERRV